MDGSNWYTYCAGNPLMFVDPSGLASANGYVPVADLNRFSTNSNGYVPLSVLNKPSTNPNGYVPTSNLLGTWPQPATTPILNTSGDSSHDGLPFLGEPGSTATRERDGEILQKRKYGPDGTPEVDIDYKHGGVGHEFPHQHVWNGKERGNAEPLPSENPEQSTNFSAPSTTSPIESLKTLTGLTGGALIIYIIISEGSRIVPIRNVVPVP